MRIIPKILTKSLAVLTVPVLMAGCVMDINKFAADLRKPAVVFDMPGAWRCSQEKAVLPTAEGKLEPCVVCTNIGGTPQAVSINKALHTVEPQGTVATCETNAFVSAPAALTPPPTGVRIGPSRQP